MTNTSIKSFVNPPSDRCSYYSISQSNFHQVRSAYIQGMSSYSFISSFEREERASFPEKIREFFSSRFCPHVRAGEDTIKGKSLLNLLASFALPSLCCAGRIILASFSLCRPELIKLYSSYAFLTFLPQALQTRSDIAAD